MNRPFQKLLIALLIAILLIFGVSGPLLRNSGDSRLAESELARGYAKIDHIAAALSDQDSRYESFSEHFVENLHRSVGMTCELLKDFVTENGYTGPTDFEQGTIVRYEDHKIELLGKPDVKLDLREEYFNADVPYIPSYTETPDIIDHVMLVIKNIEGPYYYVDWTSFDELQIYHIDNDIFEGSLGDLEKIYGAHVFVVSDEGYLIYVSSTLEDCDNVLPEEFDVKNISSGNVLNFRGTDYFCCHRHFDQQRYTIFLLSQYSDITAASKRWAMFYELLALIFVAAVLVWICFIEKKARDEILNDEKKAQYEPSRIRVSLLLFALIGVLLIFVTTYFIQLMNSLYTQTRQGDQILDVLIAASQEEEKQRAKSQSEEVEWYTYYADRLSDMIERYPELAAEKAGYTGDCEQKGEELICRPEISAELERLSRQREKSLANMAAAGYQRLAFGSICDAISLLYKSDPSKEDLEGMDLFLVSEIKRPKDGSMEIKFFDRIRALEHLEQSNTDGEAGSASPFYNALEQSARAIRKSSASEDLQ